MRLNLGCGDKAKSGFLGVDRHPCAAAGLLCDFDGHLPFRSGSIAAVDLDNVLEHVADVMKFMNEISRICQDGATVTIVTPHFTSWDSWRDPTHRHHFSYFSMDHFATSWIGAYGGCRFDVVERRLSFSGGFFGIMGRLLFTISPRWWEKKLCFVFRGGTLRFELEVRKSGLEALGQ